MKLIHFTTQNEFLKKSVAYLETICKKKKGTIHIALSGGSTPLPFYKKLRSVTSIPWERVHLFLVDERYVPITDPASNLGMIQSSLGTPLLSKLKGFTYFHTDLSIKKALDLYKSELTQVPYFDVAILGIGPDGHTASLFPKTAALKTKSMVASTQTEIFTVKKRLTITFPVILKSRHLLILMKGEDKAKTIYELCEGEKNIAEFPAKKLLRHQDLTIHFFAGNK